MSSSVAKLEISLDNNLFLFMWLNGLVVFTHTNLVSSEYRHLDAFTMPIFM